MTRPNRTIRISDALWERAASVAAANHRDLSEVVTSLLTAYCGHDPADPPSRLSAQTADTPPDPQFKPITHWGATNVHDRLEKALRDHTGEEVGNAELKVWFEESSDRSSGLVQASDHHALAVNAGRCEKCTDGGRPLLRKLRRYGRYEVL